MLSKDTRLFINTERPGNERVLHPGTVTAIDGGIITVCPDEDHLQFEVGQRIEIYYERTRKFVKQTAQIDAIEPPLEDETAASISISTTSEPETVEARQHYRVATVLENLPVMVGDEDAWLADVSTVGFSSIGQVDRQLGTTLKVTLQYEQQSFSGQAIVQSVKALPSGGVRCGFICPEDEAELHKGLRVISMETQRQQLRRRKAA